MCLHGLSSSTWVCKIKSNHVNLIFSHSALSILDRTLLSEEAFASVLVSLLASLQSFNHHLQKGLNLNQGVDNETDTIMQNSTKSVLRVILALLEPKDQIAAKLLAHPSLTDLPNQVFDAIFAIQHESTTASLENQVQQPTDDITSDIRILADTIWSTILAITSDTDLTTGAMATTFKLDILTHLKKSILDTECLAR